ncbi:MAG: hypothetical protein RBR19_13355 [Sedimentisphaerales bacterium]|jgi:hypothetical protein|nr:hypothetical protein [Sedimentisphaerales bacterium]
MIYDNALRPATLLGLVLLVLALTAAVTWLGALLDPDTPSFEAPGLIVLGLALGCAVLSLLVVLHIRWVRVTMSALLHLSIVALALALYGVASEEEALGLKVFGVALFVGGAGLCAVGILVLHSRVMKADFAGEGLSPAEAAQRRPHTRRGVIAILAVLLLALAYGAWRVVPLLMAKPTIIVDYLAEANRLSKPSNYDPNLNAAPHYEKLFAEFVPLPEGLDDQCKAWPGDLSAQQLEVLRVWAPGNEAALGLLRKAAECPYWWRVYESSDGALSGIEIPELDQVRHCAWGVMLWAKYRAYQGDPEEALSHLACLHCLGVHWTEGGTLVEQLVGLALCDLSYDAVLAVLDYCQVDANTLKLTLTSFQGRLNRIEVPHFSGGEELYGYDSIQRSFTDDGNGDGRLIPGRLYETKKGRASLYTQPISYLDALWVSLNHPGRSETQSLFAEYFDCVADLARQSPWQLHAATTSYEEELQEMLEGNYYLRDGFTAIAQCIRLGWRGKADAHATVTMLAVLTYEAQKERLPQSLEELVEEGLLDCVPMDPYSDGPLVYRVTGEGFTLYSVGEDFLDDGGEPGEWDQFGADRVFWPVVP